MSHCTSRGYTGCDRDGKAGLAGMATKISANGQLALPRHVRERLELSPGDTVEFDLNGEGEVVLRKAPAEAADAADAQRDQPVHTRLEAQMRRRAEELIALLRGLD